MVGGWYQPTEEGGEAGIKARLAERRARRGRPPETTG
jgi:hypothetical protein